MSKRKDGGQDLAFALERSFLASEFLTWLWFRCEVMGGEFKLPDVEGGAGEISVAVDDALSLVSWADDGLKATLRGGRSAGQSCLLRSL